MLMRHTAQAGGSVTQGLSSCHNATQRLYYREGSASSPTFSATHLTAKDYILQWAERTGECTSRNLSVADCTNAWRQAVFSFAIVRNPFDRQVSIFHVSAASDSQFGPSHIHSLSFCPIGSHHAALTMTRSTRARLISRSSSTNVRPLDTRGTAPHDSAVHAVSHLLRILGARALTIRSSSSDIGSSAWIVPTLSAAFGTLSSRQWWLPTGETMRASSHGSRTPPVASQSRGCSSMRRRCNMRSHSSYMSACQVAAWRYRTRRRAKAVCLRHVITQITTTMRLRVLCGARRFAILLPLATRSVLTALHDKRYQTRSQNAMVRRVARRACETERLWRVARN